MANNVRVSVQLYYEGIGDAMRLGKVRNSLRGKANQIAASARSLSSTERIVSHVGVEHGTRPKGRPYSQVTSDNAGAEFGSSKTDRRRLLGRAARI